MMRGTVLRSIAVLALYALVSGLAGWAGAEIATDYGLFGSCFEGGCAYGTIFIGFPGLWLVFFLMLFATREWTLGSSLRGWRAYGMALAAFLLSCMIVFAILLLGR